MAFAECSSKWLKMMVPTKKAAHVGRFDIEDRL